MWDLSYFNHILVYPSDYKNPQTGNYHKGETNMGGFMCFSWQAFEEGNEQANDKINLGFHEFAHALRFNGIKGNTTDYFFENYFAKWLACASKEYYKMKRNTGTGLFRKYGSVNINEFFSVAVETFFETPLAFKSTLPDLYRQTSILLNQSVADDGALVLNCRETLLKEASFSLKGSYENVLKFNMRYNGLSFLAMGFAIFGLLSLSNQGYLYPSPYILFVMAACVWVFLEQNYTRVYFNTTTIYIVKGFLLLRGYRKIQLPYSNLVSFEVAFENKTDKFNTIIKQVSAATIMYYHKGNFYEDTLHMDINQPQFDELCKELKENFVQVFIRD